MTAEKPGAPACAIVGTSGSNSERAALVTASARSVPARTCSSTGTLRALAVTSAARSELLPDVPTIAQSGVPGFAAVIHYGLLAPPATRRDIIDRLNAALEEALAADDVRARLAAEGTVPLPGTPQDYAADIDGEETKWGALVRRLNLKIE